MDFLIKNVFIEKIVKFFYSKDNELKEEALKICFQNVKLIPHGK